MWNCVLFESLGITLTNFGQKSLKILDKPWAWQGLAKIAQ